jgi:catechol 2,3-dioxygenase-like lactoylglutathione lyase family enzyme
MIKIKNLDHLVLTVKNLEETVNFYTKALGMQKETFKGSRIALKYGNQKINLHEYKNEFEPKAGNVKPGSADLCFIIDTPLLQAKKYIESLGISIEEGIVQRTGANGTIESIYLRDPDKNLIELSRYL